MEQFPQGEKMGGKYFEIPLDKNFPEFAYINLLAYGDEGVLAWKKINGIKPFNAEQPNQPSAE